MPRRLPWKISDTTSDRAASPKVKRESPRTTTASRSPSLSAAAPAPVAKKPRRERVADSDRIRSPSTSPPPEPPAERFMIPGPDEDDRYRMVEDEFLSIAHQFTTHLHRAEYNRLKALAKSQNAQAIREIERPTVGPPTLLARQRQESVKRALKQRTIHGEDGEIPWRRTSLQGLLESPRKESKWLPAGVAGMSTTRASAGYRPNTGSPSKARPPQTQLSSGKKKRRLATRDEDEGSGDDDLATPSSKVTFRPHTTPTSSTTARSTTRPFKAPQLPSSSSKITTRPVTSSHRQASSTSKVSISRTIQDEQEDEEDDDDPFGITKRRILRKQSKEQVRKAEQSRSSKDLAPDTIPSFI